MKNIVVEAFGPPEVMVCREQSPINPGPREVLVEVKAVGVNPVDTYIRSGNYANLPPLPYTPGRDAAGVVVDVGSDCDQWKIGDRVYIGAGHGTYASLLAVDRNEVHFLPDNIGFEQGAALGVPYGAAYRALVITGQARPGERLLVHGASGAVGQAVLQFARAMGLTAVGTASTEDGMQAVLAAGAQVACRHEDSGKYGPYDIIVEMLANVNLDRDLDMLARRGRVVIVGNRGRIEIDPRKTMKMDLSIRGSSLHNADPDELKEIHAAFRAGLESGYLSPKIVERMPLEEAPAAHHKVLESGNNGKIVLIP